MSSGQRADPIIAMVAISCLCGAGCATTAVRHDRFDDLPAVAAPPGSAEGVTIAYGKPNRVADGIGYMVGFPGRVLALHCRVNNHQFSEASKEQLIRYLETNRLADVYVRVNQYDPAGEWDRLRHNSRVAPGWRYSLGLAELAVYTLLPGRVFGGDVYNPFTNSLYINSDVTAVVLHEAAYAKDVHSRSLPGTYAAVNELPVLTLWHHVNAVNDILNYARDEGNWALEQETYRVVYPQMGSHAAFAGGPFVPLWETSFLHFGGTLAGRAAGELSVARESRRRATEPFAEDEDRAVDLTGNETPDNHATDAP